MLPAKKILQRKAVAMSGWEIFVSIKNVGKRIVEIILKW